MSERGKVYLVGGGPGDPELLTLRARSLIAACDALVYDQLVNPIILDWAGAACQRINMGKEPGRTDSAGRQREIHEVLVKAARAGKTVVRLKGGDPFIYGRGGEEMEALDAAGIPCEVIPGVTAALGAAAYAGIPLTHRDYSSHLVFLTGHEDPDKLKAGVRFQDFARMGGTLCIYMGMRNLDRIVACLLEGGMAANTPAIVIQHATTPRQRSLRAALVDLPQRVRDARLESPAVILVGAVAGLPEKFDWFGRRPLLGKRVVVTRSRRQSGTFRELLEAAGAEVLELPLIEIRPSVDPKVVAEVFAGLATYEWIVFTSPNGVTHFFDLFFRAYKDIRAFGGMRIAAIGASTAREIRQFNLDVELLPDEAVAESLARGLIATESLPSANVLVVTGNRNRDVLVRMLEEEGEAIVDTIQVYETVETDLARHPVARRLRQGEADILTFTSSSTVHHYHKLHEQLEPGPGVSRPAFCSIGPITSKTLRSYDLPVDMEAAEQSLPGMIQAMIDGSSARED